MADNKTIVANLKKIEAARKDCITALKEKDVTAPATMKWSQLASYIQQIGA